MITNLEVNGYRLLNDFTADLSKLNVVIGANAVGKSTLLDFLRFIAESVEYPINTALTAHGGMFSLLNASKTTGQKLSCKITFDKPLEGSWAQAPIEDRMVYEVVLQADALGQASVQYEVLKTAEPKPGYQESLKFMEATPYRRQIFDRTTHTLKPFDEIIPNAPIGENPTNGVLAIAESAQEPSLLLSKIRFFNEFPIPSWARLLLAYISVYPGFNISKTSPLRTKPAEIKPSTVLLMDGENLGTVLHEILNNYEYRSSATDLRDFLKAAYPTFEEIHCDTAYGTPAQTLVRVREKSMRRSMELGELSDGMLRFLCLATALLSPSPSPLIIIDEPEAGLHPRLLPIIADMIKTASERAQILITTHSPDLLNRFDITHIAVMTRDEDAVQTSWHRPSDRASLVQMLRSVENGTLGDLHRSGELEALD